MAGPSKSKSFWHGLVRPRVTQMEVLGVGWGGVGRGKALQLHLQEPRGFFPSASVIRLHLKSTLAHPSPFQTQSSRPPTSVRLPQPPIQVGQDAIDAGPSESLHFRAWGPGQPRPAPRPPARPGRTPRRPCHPGARAGITPRRRHPGARPGRTPRRRHPGARAGILTSLLSPSGG